MVKKFLKFLGLVLLFVLALLYFLPKENLYYLAEQELKKLDVVVGEESLDDRSIALEIFDAKIYAKGIETAELKRMQIMSALFYSSVEAEQISLAQMASSFLPRAIQRLHVSHSILDPLHVFIYAEGDFGEARGSFHLLERKLELTLEPSQLMQKSYAKSLKMFKKSESGGLVYEQTF